MAQPRYDSSPPGWEGTTEAMKSHSEISNPFALAWWMQGEGYTPHDAMNKDVLDAACEMFTAAGHNDGTTYATAGAKAPPASPATEWEAQTENLEEIPEHEDDDDDRHADDPHAPLAGPGAEGMEEHGHMMDDDEKLLDDSEVASGEHLGFGAAYPTGDTPNVGNAQIGAHGKITDILPETENAGENEISVEGEETNDDDDESYALDDDDDDAHHDDDDDDDAHHDDDDDEARRDE
jgi:hypothetical protein